MAKNGEWGGVLNVGGETSKVETIVPAEAFGELWPFAPPPGWPEDGQ